MKAKLQRSLGVFLVLLFVIATVQSYAGCPCKKKRKHKPKQNESYEKVYVAPAQVDIKGNKILVQMEDQIVTTPAIFSDENGIFIKDCSVEECDDGFWQCRTCGACNEKYYLWCRTCGNT